MRLVWCESRVMIINLLFVSQPASQPVGWMFSPVFVISVAVKNATDWRHCNCNLSASSCEYCGDHSQGKSLGYDKLIACAFKATHSDWDWDWDWCSRDCILGSSAHALFQIRAAQLCESAPADVPSFATNCYSNERRVVVHSALISRISTHIKTRMCHLKRSTKTKNENENEAAWSATREAKWSVVFATDRRDWNSLVAYWSRFLRNYLPFELHQIEEFPFLERRNWFWKLIKPPRETISIFRLKRKQKI